jgi:hypothetical protein
MQYTTNSSITAKLVLPMGTDDTLMTPTNTHITVTNPVADFKKTFTSNIVVVQPTKTRDGYIEAPILLTEGINKVEVFRSYYDDMDMNANSITLEGAIHAYLITDTTEIIVRKY